MCIYTIVIKGQLDESWEKWFEGFAMTRRDQETVLRGAVDQAALYGLLLRLRDLGLTLISVARSER